ncbi:MAG: hypothetical protein AAGL49_01150 [Pseudomonadota bacterium]
MSIEWTDVIYGAIGGGAGAALGGILAAFLGRAGSVASIALTVIGAVIGPRLAPPLLDPYIGPQIRALVGDQDRFEEELAALMEADSFLAPLFAQEPQLAAEWRERVSNAYAEGGADAAKRASFDFGQEFAVELFTKYLPRAADADILDMFSAVVDVTLALDDADPKLCHLWLFAAQTGETFRAEDFSAAVGPDLEGAMTEKAMSVIANAGESIPAYDREAAQEALNGAGQVLLAQLGAEKLDLVSGAPAETAEDASLACRATAAMHAYVLEQPNAADVYRLMFEAL